MSSILVIDDRAAERDLLSTVLGYSGHAVTQATTGEEALRLIRPDPPDLIIVDLMMPGMNGYEFMRELRADADVGDTRVVWCTATYDEQEVRRIAETCGVSHVLVKPCEPDTIIHTVDMALRANGNGPHPTVSDEFDREHLRVVNAKLSQKLDQLETAKRQAEQLHEDLRQANLKTAESLTLLQTLQATSPVGLGFVDRTFRVQQMNAELAVLNGLPADEQIGRTVAELVPDRWPKLEPLYRHVLETGEAVVNQEVHGKDPNTVGQFRHWLSSYYPVRLNDEVIGIGLVVVDITDRQQAEEFRAVVMENLAEGLLVSDGEDRLMFMNAAASRMLGWSEYELRGKSMHDAIHYQHADGSPSAETDCTLCKVRREGRIVREATDAAFTSRDGTIFPVSYSAGPLYGGDNVRGVVVAFRDSTNEQAARTRATRELDALTWVGRIRDALDDDRLVLYSQPIISLSGHAERREECLVRMIGPKGDLIPPRCFLPAAEKYGQIGEIDQWVVTQAARLASAGSHVHANLSASSIGSLDLLPRIRRALKDAGADPASLVFEITETALMDDIEAGAAFTRGIADLGCSVALDDFGTGYGSLTYLQRFSIKYLKIDVSFVRDLVTNAVNQHLVKAIVSIARGLNQLTIAEGVEDRETLELLREFGVDLAQGYYLGQPHATDRDNLWVPDGHPRVSRPEPAPLVPHA